MGFSSMLWTSYIACMHWTSCILFNSAKDFFCHFRKRFFFVISAKDFFSFPQKIFFYFRKRLFHFRKIFFFNSAKDFFSIPLRCDVISVWLGQALCVGPELARGQQSVPRDGCLALPTPLPRGLSIYLSIYLNIYLNI